MVPEAAVENQTSQPIAPEGNRLAMTVPPLALEDHAREIRAFLARRLRDRQEAEDLCQETFVRALQAKAALRDPRKLRSYLLSIANNLLLNHIRRRGLIVTERRLGKDIDLESHPDPGPRSPSTAVENSELRRKLQALLQELPAEQRTAFELGVLERQPYAEIARTHGWSVIKVKVSIYRARKHLMAGLQEHRS